MLNCKTSVSVNGIKPEMMFALMAIRQASDKAGVDLYLTSVCDGKHSDKSLHYVGYALDVDAARDVSDGEAALLHRLIVQALPREFDVLVERNQEGKFSHIHIEYQPKASAGLRIVA